MSLSNFSGLLEQWVKHADEEKTKIRREVSLYKLDEIKIRALAEVYKLEFDEVVASLLHQALLEVEEKMPYVPGNRVIRIEEGAEIYEDIGPTPEYLETVERLKGEG